MIKDFLYVYKTSLEESSRLIKKSPWILAVPILGSLAYLAISLVLARAGISFGALTPYIIRLIYSLILSQVFFFLDRAINPNILSPYSAQDGFTMYLLDIYIVRFILYIIRLLFSMLSLNYSLGMVISIGIFIVFNPIGEAIYLRGFRSYSDISFVFDFMKENFYLWGPHVFLYLVFRFFIIQSPVLDPLETYLFSYMVRISIPSLVWALIDTLYIIFRGVMFNGLYRSSRRKRAFQGGLNDLP